MILLDVIIRRKVEFRDLLKQWIEEDLKDGDVTTDPIFKDERTEAKLIAKEEGVIAGINIFTEVFNIIDDTVAIEWNVTDGDKVSNKQLIAVISGSAKSILHSERVALNLLQRMSGVATLTNVFVSELKTNTCHIYDTRKTTPGLRPIEKLAVELGGGKNHRYNLGDQILIKDNHIAAAGSLTNAVKLTNAANPNIQLEVECETMEQVKEALATGLVDIIMLDNMTNKQMSECVKVINGASIVEASGNMSVERISGVEETGVDRISVGALTHSYTSLDISLKMGV